MKMELQRSNPKIKYLIKLARRQFRQKEQKFIIEGIRFIEELLNSSWQTEALFYSAKIMNNARGVALLKTAKEQNIPCWQIASGLLKEIAHTDNPQGILALVRMPNYRLEDVFSAPRPLLLVLVDGVQDPGNLGTIVRTADAAKASGVILLKGTVDLYNPKTLRSTMGSIFHLPIIMLNDNRAVWKILQQYKVKVVLGQPEYGRTIQGIDLKQDVALVVGNEANGPSPESINFADVAATIPMPGNAESLNAAVACAIMLYEAVRQRMERP